MMRRGRLKRDQSRLGLKKSHLIRGLLMRQTGDQTEAYSTSVITIVIIAYCVLYYYISNK
jgi:hypothetical protein